MARQHINISKIDLKTDGTITSIYYTLGVIRDELFNINQLLSAIRNSAYALPDGETKDYILQTVEELDLPMSSEPIEFVELTQEIADLFTHRKQIQ